MVILIDEAFMKIQTFKGESKDERHAREIHDFLSLYVWKWKGWRREWEGRHEMET
jgi:hypothetical protein